MIEPPYPRSDVFLRSRTRLGPLRYPLKFADVASRSETRRPYHRFKVGQTVNLIPKPATAAFEPNNAHGAAERDRASAPAVEPIRPNLRPLPWCQMMRPRSLNETGRNLAAIAVVPNSGSATFVSTSADHPAPGSRLIRRRLKYRPEQLSTLRQLRAPRQELWSSEPIFQTDALRRLPALRPNGDIVHGMRRRRASVAGHSDDSLRPSVAHAVLKLLFRRSFRIGNRLRDLRFGQEAGRCRGNFGC
jgi:hypothetical protein